MSPDQRHRGLYRNRTSYLGSVLMVGSAVLIVLAMIAQATITQPSSYVGIVTFLILPGFFVIGLVALLWGMRREAGRRRKVGHDEALPYPKLDLNDRGTRQRFVLALVLGTVLAGLFAMVGYHGYLFTGSNAFCGTTCHSVMEPEYEAYLGSSHARVPCVDCHVGEGAGFFVKSKLSGAGQVLAVLFGTFERPIPVPIHHLRPARETCERCHWPKKFYEATLVQQPHFRYDEQNTPEQISLLMRTGGGDSNFGQSTGIHWHMAIQNEITYAASDPQRQTIPWVAIKRPDGSVVEYRDESSPMSEDDVAALPRRTMDCIDCHNRPSHRFPPPERSVDLEMAASHISPTLPWIKTIAVEALTQSYPTKEAASDGIRKTIREHYDKDYPEVAKARAAEIGVAIDATIAIYRRSIFPEMKVDWRSYPDNIGHRYWPGCFRCHDDKHVSPEGQRLSMDCTLCHTAPQRGPVGALGGLMPATEEEWHPWKMPAKHVAIEAHEALTCHQCHAAGRRPRGECGDCHE